MTDPWWDALKREVIDAGLCTQCGSCVGLEKGVLGFTDPVDSLPAKVDGTRKVRETTFYACPGRYFSFPETNEYVFGKQPENSLLGNYSRLYIGYARDESIRTHCSSGGVISASLIHLLQTGKIDGAVVLRMSREKPYVPEPFVAKTPAEILEAAQSKYIVTPVNILLDQLEKFNGKLAYVGLPEHVASIRKLQRIRHKAVKSITYIIGPYSGTILQISALRSFLRSHGVGSLEEIKELSFRAGEWPGRLEIKLRDGHILAIKKFYYNYLIPFYIAPHALLSTDLTNEFTDISVGDAFSPEYEKLGKGFSVVVTRTAQGQALIEEMERDGIVCLQNISADKAIQMHSHMLDFKKRGAFIRMARRKRRGFQVPELDYFPSFVPFTRKAIEMAISGFFRLGSNRIARWLLPKLPLVLIGPAFNALRISWKRLTKPTKRRGLTAMNFTIVPPGERSRFG